MAQNNSTTPFDLEEEISFFDILRFLRGAYRTILISGAFGICLSIAYLATTPKQYEATSLITMSQIGSAKSGIMSLSGVNVEDPPLLIARLSAPTSFTTPVLAACGLQGQAEASLALSRSIKLSISKGLSNVVELKAFGLTPQAASGCNLAIFEFIKTTQSQIAAPYIEEARLKLVDDEGRLVRVKNLLAKADESGLAIGAAYLSTRDEIRYLLDEITSLKNIVTSSENRAASLVAPIYTSAIPIAPKAKKVLSSGLFGGFLFGLLIAILRSVIPRIKSELAEK